MRILKLLLFLITLIVLNSEPIFALNTNPINGISMTPFLENINLNNNDLTKTVTTSFINHHQINKLLLSNNPMKQSWVQ